MNENSVKLKSLICLCVTYSYSLFYVIVAALNVNLGSFGLRIFSSLLAAIAYAIYFYDVKYRRKAENNIIAFSLVFSTVGCMITYLRYDWINTQYAGAIMSFLVRGLPAILMALWASRENNILKVIYWLPCFIILYTFSSFISAVYSFNNSLIYQSISYYSVFAYGFTLYFFFNRKHFINNETIACKWVISKPVIYTLLIIQCYCLFAGGGRGAFVLFIFVTTYYLHKLSKKHLALIICLCLILLLFIGSNIQSVISESKSEYTGAFRIINFFNDTSRLHSDQRVDIYSLAFSCFLDSPFLGNGIGGVFYELGAYSHNIILDFLIDVGIIGFSFILFLGIKAIQFYRKVITNNYHHEIPLIMGLSSFVFLFFSSNYLLDGPLWFCLSYAYAKK